MSGDSGSSRPPLQVRLSCVLPDGRTIYPYLLDLTEHAVLLYHHSSKQLIPYPWRDLIHGGATLFGCSDEEFLAFLARIVREADDDSGPSALTKEPTADGSDPRGGAGGGAA